MIHYTVRGHWPFPTDMLRRDEAQIDGDESDVIVRRLSATHSDHQDDFKDQDVKLVCPLCPNYARWESFGWKVVACDDPWFAMMQLGKEQAAKRLTMDEFDGVVSDASGYLVASTYPGPARDIMRAMVVAYNESICKD